MDVCEPNTTPIKHYTDDQEELFFAAFHLLRKIRKDLEEFNRLSLKISGEGKTNIGHYMLVQVFSNTLN